MKKICLIIALIIINFSVYAVTLKKVTLEKIDFQLAYNELGIVFLGLDSSDSLILSLNNINILYLINYKNDSDIKKELEKLDMEIDIIVMNENYDININAVKKIVKGSLTLNDIVFTNNTYSKVRYNNQTLCFNNTNCDYVYYTKNNIKVNDNKVLFFNQDLKLPDNIYKEWVDVYKINKSVYTVLKLSDTYEILEIIKNI